MALVRRLVRGALLMSAAAIIKIPGPVLLGLRADTQNWGLPAGLMELGETRRDIVREPRGITVTDSPTSS